MSEYQHEEQTRSWESTAGVPADQGAGEGGPPDQTREVDPALMSEEVSFKNGLPPEFTPPAVSEQDEFVDDAPVFARGKLNIREDRANSLLIDEIKPLGEANRSLYIRFDSLPDDLMQRACAFLKRYPGETPVVLYDAAKKIGKGAPKEFYVTISDAFLAAAQERFGKEYVKLK